MNHSLRTLLFSLLLASSGFSAHAGGDAEAGKKLASEKCQACHGLEGNADNPQFPRLAGQHADYLEHTLEHYRDGKRSNAIMAGQAAGLSDQDIEDLAAWYAGQSGLVTPVQPITVSD